MESPVQPLGGIQEEAGRRARATLPSSTIHWRTRREERERKQQKKKKKKRKQTKKKEGEVEEAEDSDEERSIIEIGRPGVKNVEIDGVLPSGNPGHQSRENIEIMKKRVKLRKKKRKRKTRKIVEEDDEVEKERERKIREELAKLDPTKAASKPDASFYPAPKNMEKRRCYIHKNARALKCTVCDGGGYGLAWYVPHYDMVLSFQSTTAPGEPSSPTCASWQTSIWAS